MESGMCPICAGGDMKKARTECRRAWVSADGRLAWAILETFNKRGHAVKGRSYPAILAVRGSFEAFYNFRFSVPRAWPHR